MPLRDHFHPPLHGPWRWEGFHHAWATFVAQQLNQETLPPDYFARPEISIGPELEIDVATLQLSPGQGGVATAAWAPPRPALSAKVDYSHLDSIEVLVYQNIGDTYLRAAVELVSPANKDRPDSRRVFAARCAGYVKHGVAVVLVDVVTSRAANLHAELMAMLRGKGRPAAWKSPTGLYAVAYRPVTVRKAPRVEMWPEVLTLGEPLPTLPLWLALDLSVPLRLEASYRAACQSLRIPA